MKFLKTDYITKRLTKKLERSQFKQNKTFSAFPIPRFNQIKGLFPTYIHLNYTDNTNSTTASLLRNHIKIKDNNGFTTKFIMLNLLEAAEFEGKLNYDINLFKQLIETQHMFQDKETKSPLHSYWHQDMGPNGIYEQSNEVNVIKIAELINKLPKSVNTFLKRK